MTVRDQVIQELEGLDERQLEYVGRLVSSLRARPSAAPFPSFDPSVYGPLYREFAAEDQAMAEQGMADYARGLEEEDGA